MKLLHTFRINFWLVIGLTVLMSLGSIWIFMRMAPAIEVIIDRNERSLQACEEMLGSVALLAESGADAEKLMADFTSALIKAEQNITEDGEEAALKHIRGAYLSAFAMDGAKIRETVTAVKSLSSINRLAMERADQRAKQIGEAGAWGIVFMGTLIFLAGMIMLRYFRNNIAEPISEVSAVMKANKSGDIFRRCTGGGHQDIYFIYNELNCLLDKTQRTDEQIDPPADRDN